MKSADKASGSVGIAATTALLCGCSLLTAHKSLSPDAVAEHVGPSCRLTLTGMFPAVHTLFPADRQYERSVRIDVPTLKGEYKANEARVAYPDANWQFEYLSGSIAFSGPSVLVSFTQHLPDHSEEAFPFNGNYTVRNPDACGVSH